MRHVASAMPEVAPSTRIFRGAAVVFGVVELVIELVIEMVIRSGTLGHALPEAGAKKGIAVAGELLPLWIERLEL